MVVRIEDGRMFSNFMIRSAFQCACVECDLHRVSCFFPILGCERKTKGSRVGEMPFPRWDQFCKVFPWRVGICYVTMIILLLPLT